MGKILTLIISLFSTLFLLQSCNDASCTDSTQVVMKIGFYKQSENKNITFDSLTVRGLYHPKDSILYNKSRAVKSISLPLHIVQDSTVYEINYYKSNSATVAHIDTIVLYHTNKPYFVSQDCGCTVFATITGFKTTGHRINNIRILINEVTNKSVEHAIFVY